MIEWLRTAPNTCSLKTERLPEALNVALMIDKNYILSLALY